MLNFLAWQLAVTGQTSSWLTILWKFKLIMALPPSVPGRLLQDPACDCEAGKR